MTFVFLLMMGRLGPPGSFETFCNFAKVTSVSKKPGQTIVLYHYCDLSRFFWNRRYPTFWVFFFHTFLRGSMGSPCCYPSLVGVLVLLCMFCTLVGCVYVLLPCRVKLPLWGRDVGVDWQGPAITAKANVPSISHFPDFKPWEKLKTTSNPSVRPQAIVTKLYMRDISVRHLEDIWQISAVKTSGRRLGSIWEAFGIRLRGIWKTSGRHLGDLG